MSQPTIAREWSYEGPRRSGKRARTGSVKSNPQRFTYRKMSLNPYPRMGVSKKEISGLVRKVLYKESETKFQNYGFTLNPMCLQTSSSILPGNYAVLTPSNSLSNGYTIARGTANNQMIGNNIRIKKLTLSYAITPKPYNDTTNTQPRPNNLRIWIFKSKVNPTADQTIAQFANSATTGTANFLDLGSGDYGHVGSMFDFTRLIDSNNYTYLTHRDYKIGSATPQTTSGTTTYHIMTNNDYSLNIVDKIELQKYASKLTQNDAGQWTIPWIFMLVQVVCADGSVYVQTQYPVNMICNVNCSYTDA